MSFIGPLLFSLNIFKNSNINVNEISLDGVTNLQESAFMDFNIKSVYIKNINTVPDRCFYGCTGIKKLYVENVNSLGRQCFYQAGLEKITPDMFKNVGSFGPNCFMENESLTEVEIDGNPELKDGLFWKCSNLKKVVMDGITELPNGTFEECPSLEEVSLKNVRRMYPEEYFKGCTKLRKLYMGSLEEVNLISRFLADSKSLEEVDLHSLKSIRGNNISFGKALIKLSLDSIDYVPRNFLSNCTNLEELSLNSVPEFMWGNVLSGKTQLKKVSLNAFTSVPDGLFNDCPNLEEVSLLSVTSVPDDFLSGYTHLRKVLLGCIDRIPDCITANAADMENLALSVKSVPDGFLNKFTNLRTLQLDNVSSLPANALSDCEKLEKVSLNGMTELPEGFFTNNKALKSVSLNAVTTLSDSPLAGCDKLEEVSMNSVSDVPDGEFKDYSNLASVSFKNAVTLGASAFEGCSSLTGVDVENCETVGNRCFYNSLTKDSAVVSLPVCTTVGDEAFSGATALDSVYLPAAVTLGNSSFFGCTRLTNKYYPSVETVGDNCFANDKAITEVHMPKVITLGTGAFSGNALETIDMPELKEVTEGSNGAMTFAGGGRLKNINMPKLTVMGSRMFDGGAGPLDGTVDVKNVRTLCVDNIAGGDFTPEVLSLPALEQTYSFSAGKCTIENRLPVNGGIKKLYTGTFAGEIAVQDDATALERLDIPSATKLSGTLNTTKLNTLVMPCVTDISGLGFKQNSSLDSVVVKNGDMLHSLAQAVRNGKDEAADIENVTLAGPGDVMPEKASAGDDYFDGIATKHVVIGRDATIGNGRLISGLKNLVSIQAEDGNENYENGNGVVYELSGGMKKLVACPVMLKAAYGIFNLDDNSMVGDYAFAGNRTLESVTVGGECTEIGASAFNGSAVKNIALNDNALTTIGQEAFANMTSEEFRYMHLPYSVTTIGSGAFENSRGMLAVEMQNTKVTSIADNTFAGMTALTSIALPDAVTTIGRNAFKDDKGMKYFTVPKECTSIGEGAFSGTSLDYLNIQKYNSELAASLPAAFDGADKKPTVLVAPAYADAFKNLGFVTESSRSITIDAGRYVEVSRSYPFSLTWSYRRGYDGRRGSKSIHFYRVVDDMKNELDVNGDNVRVLTLVEMTDKDLRYIPANTPLLAWAPTDPGFTPQLTFNVRGDDESKDAAWAALFEKENNPLVGTPAAAHLDEFVYEPNYFAAHRIADMQYQNFLMTTSDQYPQGYYKPAPNYKDAWSKQAYLDGETCYLRLRLEEKAPGLPVQTIKSVRLVVDPDYVTAIDDVNEDDRQMNAAGDGRCYRMDGTSTAERPVVPGIYIHNGKKYVIK